MTDPLKRIKRQLLAALIILKRLRNQPISWFGSYAYFFDGLQINRVTHSNF